MPTTCCWTIQSIMVCACFLVNLKLTLTHSLAVRNKVGKGKHETSGSCFTSPTYDLTCRKQRVSVVFRNPVRLVCPWFLKPRRAPNRQQISSVVKHVVNVGSTLSLNNHMDTLRDKNTSTRDKSLFLKFSILQ